MISSPAHPQARSADEELKPAKPGTMGLVLVMGEAAAKIQDSGQVLPVGADSSAQPCVGPTPPSKILHQLVVT